MRLLHDSGVDPYVPGHGDASFDVVHYDLDLTYKVEGNHLSGRAVLECVALSDLDQVRLDLQGMRVRKVLLDGRRAKYSHSRTHLTLRMPATVHADETFHVVVQYAGTPKPIRDRHLGSAGWEELTDGSIVAAQPHGSPSWFPCNDRPDNKASYRFSVTAPSDYRVVANGTFVSSRRGASATTWEFDQPEPMATYLATVHVGRYELREVEAPIPMYAVLPFGRQDAFDSAFGGHAEMVSFFEATFGPYPFAQYTVVIADDELEIPLESQSLSTFGVNHLGASWDVERLVAHELAHQWFGNSLTLERWSDIWLHEGFACYSEWLWSEQAGKATAQKRAVEHWRKLDEQDQDLVLEDPGPDLMFDDRVYKRGALLLHALRRSLGEDTFFGLLRTWVSEHAHRGVSTNDFVRHAEETAGRSLSELFNAWLVEKPLPPLPDGG